MNGDPDVILLTVHLLLGGLDRRDTVAEDTRLVAAHLYLAAHDYHRALDPHFRRLLIGLGEDRDANRAIHVLKLHDAHSIAFLGGDAPRLFNHATQHNLLAIHLLCDIGGRMRRLLFEQVAQIGQWMLRDIDTDEFFLPL